MFLTVVVVMWVYTFVKPKRTVYLKCIHFTVYKLYLSKVDLNEKY